MNKKTKLFLLMNIGNYVLVLLAFLGFRLGAGISVIFFLFCQPALQLYYQFISSDSETLLVGRIEAQIGIVYVIILSVIAIIIAALEKLNNRKK